MQVKRAELERRRLALLVEQAADLMATRALLAQAVEAEVTALSRNAWARKNATDEVIEKSTDFRR